MHKILFLTMLIHLGLTACLYVMLTVMRAPVIWNIGKNKKGENPFVAIEQRTSANLTNQFEWPLFFHIACVILLFNEMFYSVTYLYLAWVFIAGRVLHSYVHIFTTNIRLRGIVFTINFIAVFLIWVLLLIDYIGL